MDERLLWQELQDAGLKQEQTPQRVRQAKRTPQKLSTRAHIENQLIEALIQSPTLIPSVKSEFHYQNFTEPRFSQIAQLLWEACADNDNESVDIQALINTCPDETVRGFVSNALLRRTPPPNLLQARVNGCLNKLKDFLLQDLEQRIRSHALAEGTDEVETLKELVKLSNQRRALTGQPSEKEQINHGF